MHAPSDHARFVAVDVDPGPAAPDGLSLRFKRAGEDRPVARVAFESDDGLAGVWKVAAAGDPDGVLTAPAVAVPVEDSSEGTVWLVHGGRYGLVLEHPSGARVREAYLVLAPRALVS